MNRHQPRGLGLLVFGTGIPGDVVGACADFLFIAVAELAATDSRSPASLFGRPAPPDTDSNSSSFSISSDMVFVSVLGKCVPQQPP